MTRLAEGLALSGDDECLDLASTAARHARANGDHPIDAIAQHCDARYVNAILARCRYLLGALWAFGARADSWFIDQTDGNLVAYRSEGGFVWSANSYGHGAGNLVLQDDGNLVLYRVTDHAVLWSTNTYGT